MMMVTGVLLLVTAVPVPLVSICQVGAGSFDGRPALGEVG